MRLIKLSHMVIYFLLTLKVYVNSLSMIGQSKTIPEKYELLLDFSGNNNDCSKKNCIYTGEVNITVKVIGRTEFFSIQADSKIKIDEAKTRLYRYQSDNTLQQIPIIDFSATRGDVSSIIEIYLEQMNAIVAKTRYIIELFFSRDFEDLRGYYQPVDDTSNRILVIALLIPNRAYRVFPCLSDIKWLSTFELSIIHPSDFTAIAGTPLKYSRKISPYTSLSVYQPSAKIQAHHVFFVIWNYQKYHTDLIDFWYPPDVPEKNVKNLIVYCLHSFGLMINNTIGYHTPFALNIAPFPGSRVIDFYTTHGTALFRWMNGLISVYYRIQCSRESQTIFDNDESTTTDRMEMLTDISRSTVRYWIGILHHPRLWEDFWIYAAVADYIATFIFDALEPDFRIHDYSLARTILWTRCDRDTLSASTIPFYLFDTWDDRRYFRKEEYTSYQALTIAGTIHQLFDFKDVMELIRLFLSRWKNESFGPTLKDILSVMNDKNVENFTNDWLKNRGTPLITINLDEFGEYAELIQERFNTFGPGNSLDYTWSIPIRCFNQKTHRYYHLWLKSKTLFVNATEIKYCLLSGHSVVPYRVNYPEAWWIDIIELLIHNPLTVNEMQRMWIIDDLYELSIAGYIHIEYLYNLFEYLPLEYDYFPWLAAGKVFGKLKNMLSLSKYMNHKIFHKRMFVRLISNVYNKLKMNPTGPEDYYIRLHRKNIINLACGFGHDGCLKESKARLECYLKAVSGNRCPHGRCPMAWKHCAANPDIREIIFCQGLRRASPKFWYRVFQLLNTSTLFHSTRLVISRGLACTENVHILENYLNFMLNNEQLFPGENIFPILLTAARLSEDHAQLVLYFITKNHLKLVDRIQTAHEYHKHTNHIAEEIYSDENFRKTSKHIPDDEEVSYLLPENVKKVVSTNTKVADRIRPMIDSYIEKKMGKSRV